MVEQTQDTQEETLDVSIDLQGQPSETADASATLEQDQELTQEVPQEQPEQPFSLSTELVKGAYNGLSGAGHAITDLAVDGINALTGSELTTPEPYEFKTGTVGSLTDGITQFAAGWAVGGAALKGIKAVSTGTKIAKGALQGAIADFVSFTEEEERLSNLVQSYPALQNPVTDYLEASPDDNWAEGRFKNVLEGMGIGAGIGAVTQAVKGLKQAKVLEGQGKTEEAAKVMEESRTAVSRAMEDTIDQTITTQPKFTPEQTQAVRERIESGSGDLDAVSDAFNVRKWNSTEEGKQAIDAAVQEMARIDPETFTGVQSLKATAKMAEDLLGDPATLTKVMEERAKESPKWAAEMVAANIKTITAADGLGKLAVDKQTALASGDTNAVEGLTTKMDELIDMVMSETQNLKAVQKNHARAVGSGRIVKESNLDPENLEAIKADFKGDKEGFHKWLAKTQGDPSTTRKAIRMAVDNRAWDIANEFWINSILSGPWTQVVNVGSAAVESVVKPLESSLGAIIRGNKTAAKTELKAYTGLRHSILDSYSMAKKTLLEEKNILDPIHSVNEEQATKAINLRLGGNLRPTRGDDWFIDVGAAIRIPSRFLAAGDEFFKQINYRSKLYSEGYLDGIEKGLKGVELDNYAKNNVSNGFDLKTGQAVDQKALRYAQETTFTEDLEYGFGKWIQSGVNKAPIMRQILPFIRTPTNLYRHTIRRTPAFALDQYAREAFMGKHGPKAKSEQLARLATGSAMITTAALMSAEDMIVGAAPKDKDLRRQFIDSGRKEYSFKGPNGKYYQFNRLDPRFATLGIVADIAKHISELPEEEQSLAAFVPVAMVSSVNNLTSKSYLKGLSQTLEVLNSDDPEAWDRYFNWQIGSRVVPYSSFMRTVNPDKELKELRDWTDGILSNIPGFSENVEPKRNVLGQPMEAGSNPFTSVKTSSIVKEEFVYLDEQFGLPPKRIPSTRIDMTNYENEGGQTAYDRYQELAGQITYKGKNLEKSLEELIKSPMYQKLPPLNEDQAFRSKRSDLISARIRAYRNVALKEIRKEYPDLDKDIRIEQRNNATAPYKGSSVIQKLTSQK